MKQLVKFALVGAFGVVVSMAAQAADMFSAADLDAKRSGLSGQQVSVEGTVVKVNNGIMRRNFIHVEDATGKVIFTSNQTAQVGDKVVATGTVKLDTNFGMGYAYPLLVEDATFAPAK